MLGWGKCGRVWGASGFLVVSESWQGLGCPDGEVLTRFSMLG